MGCGFGACLGCVIPGTEKPFIVSCSEGPILSAGEDPVVKTSSHRDLGPWGRGLSRVSTRAAARAAPYDSRDAGAAMLMTPSPSRLGPLSLKNPITTASGTFGYGLEFTDFVDLAALGGLCTKGLSLRPHAGNPPPRICETPAGMLNAIGLQNVGIEAFLSEKLPKLRALGATVIANVWGDLEDDYVTVVRALEGAEGIAAVELNISCPNVRQGGMLFGNSPPLTRSLVAKVRAATRAAAHRQALAQRARPRRVRAARRARPAPTSSRS